jgi:hypothetical protein
VDVRRGRDERADAAPRVPYQMLWRCRVFRHHATARSGLNALHVSQPASGWEDHFLALHGAQERPITASWLFSTMRHPPTRGGAVS